jgi:hypothetical protein
VCQNPKTDPLATLQGQYSAVADTRHGTARMTDQLQIRRFCVRWPTIVIAARASERHPSSAKM